MILISYDIQNDKLRTKFAKYIKKNMVIDYNILFLR